MPEIRPLPLPPLGPEPLVSVLVANYNYARFLPVCLESVLGQTYQNFEVIVCDDGSTDDSLAVLERIARLDTRVRVFSQVNGGQASALNRAFRESHGEIISILDADDILCPTKLRETVRSFESDATAGMATHRVSLVDAIGRGIRRPPLPSMLDSGDVRSLLVRQGLTCSLPPASGISLRRPTAERVFPIPIAFVQIADGFLARAAALTTCVAANASVLAYYRVHSASLTGIHAYSVDALRKQISLAKQLCGELCSWATSREAITISAPDALSRNSSFLENTLALHVVTTRKSARDRRILSAVLHGTSSPARKAAWRLLYSLEPDLASRALLHWWGPSSIKARVHRILVLLERKSHNSVAA